MTNELMKLYRDKIKSGKVTPIKQRSNAYEFTKDAIAKIVSARPNYNIKGIQYAM